jgi:hypothetical protein
MKVAFNSSLDDTVAVYEALILKQRENGQVKSPLRLTLITTAWMVFFTVILWVLMEEPPYFMGAVLPVAVGLVAYSNFWGLRKRLRTQFIKLHPEGQWNPNITEINDSGVTHIGTDNATGFWWSQITEITRAQDYLRFYTTLGSVSQIPLRVFRNPQEIEQFEVEAKRLWEAHRNDPPIEFPDISGIITDDLTAPGLTIFNPALSPSTSESP